MNGSRNNSSSIDKAKGKTGQVLVGTGNYGGTLSWLAAEGADAGVAWHHGDPVREQRALERGEGAFGPLPALRVRARRDIAILRREEIVDRRGRRRPHQRALLL